MKKKNSWPYSCRLKSRRLKEKALLPIDGLPLIIHTLKECKCVRIIRSNVCTDSKKSKIGRKAGGKSLLTKIVIKRALIE